MVSDRFDQWNCTVTKMLGWIKLIEFELGCTLFITLYGSNYSHVTFSIKALLLQLLLSIKNLTAGELKARNSLHFCLTKHFPFEIHCNAWSNLTQDIQFLEFMGGSKCPLICMHFIQVSRYYSNLLSFETLVYVTSVEYWLTKFFAPRNGFLNGFWLFLPMKLHRNTGMDSLSLNWDALCSQCCKGVIIVMWRT